MLLKKTALLMIVLFLVSCGTKEISKRDGQLYFDQALKYYNAKRYGKASETFEEAIKYAASPELAAKAQIYLGNSYFYQKNYLEAIPSYKQYLDYYPNSPESPEILYKLSFSYYKEAKNIDREQTTTAEALESFLKLKKLYPDYAKKQHVDRYIKKLTNNLANKEYYIANFYFRTGKKTAAEKRLKYLLEHYKTSDIYINALVKYCNYLSKDKKRKNEAIYYLNMLLSESSSGNIPAEQVSELLKKLKSSTNL